MPTLNLFYGDQIAIGSQPVLVFPITVSTIILASTESGTLAGTLSGVEGSEAIAGTFTGTDASTGWQAEAPRAGLLANLTVNVSKDGLPFTVGAGVLAEIGNGYYSYIPDPTETNRPPTPDSSNTGAVLVRVFPTAQTLIAGSSTYIHETSITFRLKPPGTPLARLAPGQQQTVSELLQPIVNSINNFTQQAIRDLLGNQMTNKPTFRKDP